MLPTFNLRAILWATLAMALLLNYFAWQVEFPPPAAPAGTTANAPAANGAANGTGPDLGSVAPVINASPAPAAAPGAAPASAGSAPGTSTAGSLANPAVGNALDASTASAAAPNVHVVTDVLDVLVSLEGGELTRVDLPAYPLVKGEPTPVRLLNRDGPKSLFVLQSGLAGAAGVPMPTNTARFSAPASELRLAAGQDELRLPLTWTDDKGVTVTKTYTFRRGQYRIGLDYRVHNGAAAPWTYTPYTQLLRYNEPVANSYFHPESYAYKGPAYDDGQKYQKLKMGKEPPTLDRQIDGGWLAAMQHHFVAAIVPPTGAPWNYRLTTRGDEYLLAAIGPTQQVAPGASASLHQRLFVGPKLRVQLDQTNPRLYLVADYGWLSAVARPLFWLLDHVHRVVGNWGWTIMIATLLLKLLFYPLSEASMRSMARMKALQPRIKALQEMYKDQRDKLGKATMELYQKEKVNPVAGCLPMLLQFPVFLAFYWVLLESVEMRQAPFIGWIGDLSARDPLFILPALMAGANYINFKLNPQMGDPTQQKMFMIMQIAMPVMFAFMPSGLVLYWTTNTVLSILQQWNINRRLAAQAKARN
ncbi:MAG: membrane protein insertase YidC [Gammaproteobacteria bacterium]|nr:membrane protein insertase YidC [Gammaproteobacteria bacterium]MDE2252360.1 membrane protein insertase YidC [Gammaproteobacteria bacterium]